MVEMKATDRQVRMLLEICFHYMKQDLRGKLIRECPQAYNAYVGHEVVKVYHSDGRIA